VQGGKRQGFLIGAVVGGGAATLASIWLVAGQPLDRHTLILALILVAVSTAAELLAIRLPHGATAELITIFEAAVVVDLVLLPPALGPTVAAIGLALSLLIRRKNPVKAAYNLGQYTIAVVAAAAVYHQFGGDFSTQAGLIGLTLGMTAFVLSNLVTIAAIISAITGRRLATIVREEIGLSFATGLGNAAVGIVAAALWLTRPALLPAVLAPALALHLAFRGWVRQRELLRDILEEKSKLDRIVEHSSEGIVLLDTSGSVALWSPSMERITGVLAAEANGKAISYLLRGHGAGGKALVVEAGGAEEDLQIVRADGTERWIRVQHGPAVDSDGALIHDVIVVRDVTREREVARLKDDFVSTVSHELRTPLTPIKGYAMTLLRYGNQVEDDVRQRALESILERTDHMHRLVEDLLLASRMSSDTGPVELEVLRDRVDVVEVAERALRGVRASHPDRSFPLLAVEPALAIADAIRVEQVLANLISNAVKFSPAGTPIETIVVHDGGEVVISVKDYGRGIPEEKLGVIFEKFRRLENPDRMETGGAGLGLYIVEHLTKAMEGSVSVLSRVGDGSTFTVRLPTAVPEAGRSEPRMPGGTRHAEAEDPSARTA
jgi:PAS domain S-box-containing protein